MKRIMLALALLASMQVVSAQIKSDESIQKAVAKAEAASQDAKKGAKAATWMNLGKAYVTAYNNPSANITQWIDKQTFALMAGEKPITTEIVTVGGETYEKQVLSHTNVYFNTAGQLALYEVTHPSVEGDVLAKAAEAYVKAYELGGKVKDVTAALENIDQYYYNDAVTSYTFGDLATASRLFRRAADVSLLEQSPRIDTNAVYNTAFTAMAVSDFPTAKTYYKKCIDLGYTSEGSVFASLSTCALAEQDTLAAKAYLVDGLRQYPDNAAILTNLINLYISLKEDPAKIVELLDEAKAQMPDNASLYYVEGNIRTGIKDYDGALAAYRKASEIGAATSYEWGYYGEGILWYQRAVDAQEAANELPVTAYREYDAKMAELNQDLKNAIEPFERCYELTQETVLRQAAADNLKRIYFALRNESEEYKAGYEKYEAILAE